MDTLQQRILEIAQQIPEYVGYQAKERRRESDRLIRRQLAAKYDEQRVLLARIRRQAPLDHITELENLDQKLQRLIARLNIAPLGYAGWFDAGQIVEGDLDQLVEFDSKLTDGVDALKKALEQVAAALKAKEGIDAAISACADQLDALNIQFDQREQFLSMGKRPSLAMPSAKPSPSPLQALDAKSSLPSATSALASLKLNDAVSFERSDYIVSGKITFSASAGTFWAFLLKDREQTRWLRVGPSDEASICQVIAFSVPSPLPNELVVESRSYRLKDSGTARVDVEGAGGMRRGSANYARYAGDQGERLWIEDYGTEKRAMQGQAIEASDLTVYRR